MPHNVVIASADPAKDPAAETFLDGEIITGPGAFDYEVAALPEAEYFYFCKVHPTTMTGILTVAVGAEPGTGASGNVITAANLAFDRDTLSFPAGTPSTLTFQNDDAGDAAQRRDLHRRVGVGGAVPRRDRDRRRLDRVRDPGAQGRVVLLPVRRAPDDERHRHGRHEAGGGLRAVAGSAAPPTDAAARPPAPRHRPTSGGATSERRRDGDRGNLAFDSDRRSRCRRSRRRRSRSTTRTPASRTTSSIWTDDSYSGERAVHRRARDRRRVRSTTTSPRSIPGTYAFRCDVHPTMIGTVTVG